LDVQSRTLRARGKFTWRVFLFAD
ncbi:transposase, partial [Shigella flexneri]|nr:transposase [Shigella flexneri]EFX9978315.1 transposase [Shigella flexneri]EFY0014289.1 transposase [Shigella flexneri]MJA79741.1 transposase [Shigella flexneri]